MFNRRALLAAIGRQTLNVYAPTTKPAKPAPQAQS